MSNLEWLEETQILTFYFPTEVPEEHDRPLCLTMRTHLAHLLHTMAGVPLHRSTVGEVASFTHRRNVEPGKVHRGVMVRLHPELTPSIGAARLESCVLHFAKSLPELLAGDSPTVDKDSLGSYSQTPDLWQYVMSGFDLEFQSETDVLGKWTLSMDLDDPQYRLVVQDLIENPDAVSEPSGQDVVDAPTAPEADQESDEQEEALLLAVARRDAAQKSLQAREEDVRRLNAMSPDVPTLHLQQRAIQIAVDKRDEARGLFQAAQQEVQRLGGTVSQDPAQTELAELKRVHERLVNESLHHAVNRRDALKALLKAEEEEIERLRALVPYNSLIHAPLDLFPIN